MKAPAGIGVDLEGIHAVTAAVQAGRAQKLWIDTRRLSNPPVVSLIECAEQAGVGIELITDLGSRAQTSSPQGVVARCRPLPVFGVSELLEFVSPSALLALDHWHDPHNLGAAIRSAVAAGIPALLLPRRRAAPITAAVGKVAAGALEQIRIGYVASLPEAIRWLSQRGVWSVGLAADAKRSLWNLELFTEPVVIVAGGEAQGLGKLVRNRLDLTVAIPMVVGVESLNAAVAVSLACYELKRVRLGAGVAG